MTLIGILGGLGKGKTLLETYLALKTIELNLYDYVYANYWIKNPKVHCHITPLDLLNINPKDNERALLCLDEIYAWLESRISSSIINRFLTWIVLQSRKRNMDIIYTAQLSSTYDLRVRDLTDYIVIARKTKNSFIYYLFFQDGLNLRQKCFGFSIETAREKYFNLFNTREIIAPIFLEDAKAELEKTFKPADLNKRINILATQVRERIPENAKVTKSMVSAILLELGENPKYADIVNAKLKLGVKNAM